MNEKDLENIAWNGIAFMQQADNKILLLSCKDEAAAQNLLKTIKENPISLKVSITPENHYVIDLEFTNTEYGIRNNTGYKDEDYPQLEWLKNQEITHLTTGYWDEQNNRKYLPDFHPVENLLHLN